MALWAQVAAGVLSVSIGGLQRANLDELRARIPFAPILALLTTIHDNAWWQLPTVVILAGALGLLRKHLGSPWLWDAVHFHLDELRKFAFVVGRDDAEHYHRVTLFKHVRWLSRWRRWPWSGWLVAVERSGHTTRGGVQYFK